MKDLIKVEKLRQKMTDAARPSKYEFMELLGTGKHKVKPTQIDRMKELLKRDYENNIAWLEGRKTKYEPKQKSA